MTDSSSKKSVARSKEDKEKQFERIIDAGRELFVKHGIYGFSTRALAKKLNVSQGFLYTYFNSKRELLIAIRNKDYEIIMEKLESIIRNHNGNYISLLKKVGYFYLEFADEEYYRFQMILMVPLPPSNNVGPIEKDIKELELINLIRRLIKEAMDANEIKKTDINNLSNFMMSLIHGATHIERILKKELKMLSPGNDQFKKKAINNFRNNIIDQMIAGFLKMDLEILSPENDQFEKKAINNFRNNIFNQIPSSRVSSASWMKKRRCCSS